MTEPNTTSPSPATRPSSTVLDEERDIPPEVKSSVLYAKISSDYLCGHAASILHIAQTIQYPTHHTGNTTEWDIDSHGHPIIPRTSTPDDPTEPANGSFQDLETLLDARWSLLRDLKQFETDSMEWAQYLENGYEVEGEGEPVHIPCSMEAAEIRRAVEKAREDVRKAVREIVGGDGVEVEVGGCEERGESGEERRKGVKSKVCGCFCFDTE